MLPTTWRCSAKEQCYYDLKVDLTFKVVVKTIVRWTVAVTIAASLARGQTFFKPRSVVRGRCPVMEWFGRALVRAAGPRTN
jgi:hypothetical protein